MGFWGSPFLWILLCGICGEFVIPIFLKCFYPSYHPLRDAMGKLSNPHSPVGGIHRIWRILLGTIFVLAGISFYLTLGGPLSLRIPLLIFCILFGLGARILPAFLSIADVYEVESVPAKIHRIANTIGCFALQLAALALIAILCITGKYTLGSLLGLSALIGIFAYVLSVLSHRHEFSETILEYRGIWEGIFLLFIYTPVAATAIVYLLGN